MKKTNLTIKELRKLIFENHTNLSELDVVDTDNSDPKDDDEQNTTVSFSEGILPGLYEKLSPKEQEFVNAEIQSALENGRSVINSEWAQSNKKTDVFNYFTSKLAHLYNNGSMSYEDAVTKLEQNGNPEWTKFYEMFVGEGKKLSEIAKALNKESATEVREEIKTPVFRFLETKNQVKIKQALLSAFVPVRNGRPTAFFNFVRSRLGVDASIGRASSGGFDASDTILDGIYNGFERALQSYQPKGTFYNLVVQASIDTAKSMFTAIKGGHRVANQSNSLDANMDGSEDSGTFGDNVIDSDELDQTNNNRFIHATDSQMDKIINKVDKQNKPKTERELLYQAVVEYIQNLLKSGKSKTASDVFDLLFIKQVSPEVAAKKLGMSRGAIDKKVHDIKKLINLKMDEFKTHLGQEIGRDVQFPNNKFNPQIADLREIKAILAQIIFESSMNRLKRIDEVYEKLGNTMTLLAETYPSVEEGQEVATMDLFQRIKEFVDNATNALNEVGTDLHQIFEIAGDIHMEYPEISSELESTVNPMIEKIYEYPGKLRKMLQVARMKYNPTRAYGL